MSLRFTAKGALEQTVLNFKILCLEYLRLFEVKADGFILCTATGALVIDLPPPSPDRMHIDHLDGVSL